ncbi:mitochondrial glycoprotein [Entophlyctis helioformis]|nr:mitochondrial glycoprotein [Entophlyctis helioformis]
MFKIAAARLATASFASVAVKRTAALRPAAAVAAVRSFAPLAPIRRFAHGTVNKDVSEKVLAELKYEQDALADQDTSFIEEFKKKGVWKVEEKAGSKEVHIVRTFGNEKITVYFNTDALQGEDNFDEAEQEDVEPELPVVTSVIIEKAGSDTALEITATAQDGAFFIDHVSVVKPAAVALDQTAEGDWIRRGQYGGPVFGDLDEGLQEVFHKYLEERGFDTGLANFIGLYIEDKEQREYRDWLKTLNDFVSK